MLCVVDDPCNECGRALLLPGVEGEPCGSCGGEWVCTGINAMVCDGQVPRNACGGCGELTLEVGARCSADGEFAGLEGAAACGEGVAFCRPLSALNPGAPGLDDDLFNPCGGTMALRTDAGDLAGASDIPGERCGSCREGIWTCADAGTIACSIPESEQVNACGGCGQLDAQPDTPCGACGSGQWRCDDEDSLVCVGASEALNACGSCEELPAAPGESCGTCLQWACESSLAGGRLRCEPVTDGPLCGTFLTCAELSCEEDNRACVESDGTDDAYCDACISGYRADADACVPLTTCADLGCAAQQRECVPAGATTDAFCGA